MVVATREMVNLAEELIRIGKCEVRYPLKKLLRFSCKMEKLRSGEIHPGDVIVPLIREMKDHVRRSKLHEMDKCLKLIILNNKENTYYEELKVMVFTEKGK